MEGECMKWNKEKSSAEVGWIEIGVMHVKLKDKQYKE